MWSPRLNAKGVRNQFYENMRTVRPGNVVFSFCDSRLKAIGLARGQLFDYLEVFYNQRRRHSTLRLISPAAFERRAAA